MRYRLAISTICAVILLSSLSSAESVPPRAVLENFFRRTTTMLTEATDAKQAGEDVRDLAHSLFDGHCAARRALASEWDHRTDAEREEFARMFTRVLSHAYLEIVRGWLPRDRPPTIRVLGEETVGARAAIVRTSVQVRDGSDVPLDYLMIRAGERWLVRDVEIYGVSLLDNYRAQFTRVLRTSSYAELLARLRAMVGSGVGEPVASPKAASRPDVVVTYFDTGRAELGEAARRALEGIVEWLTADDQARVLVEGHADQQGLAGASVQGRVALGPAPAPASAASATSRIWAMPPLAVPARPTSTASTSTPTSGCPRTIAPALNSSAATSSAPARPAPRPAPGRQTRGP